MNPFARLFAVALGLSLAAAGCQSLDLAPESDPERVVSGTITMTSDVQFPPDAELVVRVIEHTTVERTRLAGAEAPVVDNNPAPKIERVLGEQVIRAPGAKPIPFRVEFRADDATLRRGLNIDARLSQGGKLRYRTLNAHLLTLGSVSYPHEVVVEPVQ